MSTTFGAESDTGVLPDWVWEDDDWLRVDDERFCLTPLEGADPNRHHVVLKNAALLRSYESLIRRERPRRIVELGMKDGGSTALLAVAARPDALLGIDLNPTPPARLTDLISRRGLERTVALRCGLDQADRHALIDAVAVLGNEPLDVVFDDASHILAPTISSFEVLFPLLRPGGLFVLEDWCSDNTVANEIAKHAVVDGQLSERIARVRAAIDELNSPGGSLPPDLMAALSAVHATRTAEGPTDAGAGAGDALDLIHVILRALSSVDIDALRTVERPAGRPLSDLVVRLVLAAASSNDIIDEVIVDPHWVVVRRGSAPIPPDTFRASSLAADHFGNLPGSEGVTAA